MKAIYQYPFFSIIKFFLLIIIGGILQGRAVAQSQQLISADQGLSSSLVGDILQDCNGNLWIATENGLNKYDGVKLTKYFHDESDSHSLLNNYVRSIFEDKDGHLFVGSYTGLQIYDPATDSFSIPATDEKGDYFHNIINKIYSNSKGDVIVTGDVICKISLAKDGHPIMNPIDLAIPTTAMEGFIEDRQGSIWITREASGVYRLDKDNSVHKYLSNLGVDPIPTCIEEDMQGNILIGTTRNGVLKYDPSADKFEQIDNGKYIVKSLMVNNSEETFVCSDGEGLKCYNNRTNQITDYQFDAEFVESKKSKIHAATKDNLGNLWIAIYQHGIMMIPAQKSAFKYIGSHSQSQDIIGRCCITCVNISKDGSLLYVGTDNDGLYILSDNNTKARHLTSENCPNMPPIIIGTYEDSEGNLWIGSYGYGAAILDKNGVCTPVKGLIEDSGEPVGNVYDFAEDKEKRVWIATMGGGLQCYDLASKKLTRDHEINRRINNWIGCIRYSKKTNSLLIGTYGGLWKIGLDEFGKNNKQVLASSIIHDVYEDKEGFIWAASSDGLARWEYGVKGPDGKEVHLFSKEDGFPSNICYSIQEDDFDRIWVSTGYGLVRMHRKLYGPTTYYVEDGIQGNEFSKKASASDPKTGNLYFGGVNGITWFSPQEVLSYSHKWDVHISNMYIAGNPVKVGTKSGSINIIEEPVYMAEKFTLNHNDNAFTIEIGTNDLGNSAKKIIYYSMEDDSWIALPKGVQQVSFSSLPPGKYTFKAKVTDGALESDIRTISIIIRPAWWQTWWSILIFLSIVGYIIYYIIIQIRHRRILRHKMLQHMQAERISESKLQFLTNVSHEIRTPMTLIINPLQQLINSDKDENRQRSYQTMQRNANRIMGLVNELMDVRKIEHGQLKMQMKEIELSTYLENITSNFDEISEYKNIKLAFYRKGLDQLMAWIDVEYFDKVILNLLSNAFKYTPEGGHINIILSKIENPGSEKPLDNAAEIIVEDSGIGIPEDDLTKIFERFFQARNKKSGTGTGVGLHLTRSIVMLHHGTIEATKNTDEPTGSRFIIHIPLGNAHLSKEEIAETQSIITPMVQQPRIKIENEEKANTYTPQSTEPTAKTNKENDSVKRILIVEDDDEIRNYLNEELSSKYKVITCQNGVEALEEMHSKAPNLIISDVMMPEMDGFTLCRKIRQNIQYNEVPIILLTAKSLNDDYIHGLELGADAYITKPFDLRILKQSISSLLKSRQSLKNIYSGSQAQEGKVDELEAKTPDEKLIDKVMKVINDNISNPDLSVEMIADEVGVSRVHLHRKLRQLTNQTTRDLIRNQRITLAAKLLREKKMPIAEVAYFVGFSSPAHFTTSFKSMFGISPSQYTNQNKEEE